MLKSLRVPRLSSRDLASFVGLVVGGSFKCVFGLASFCLWLASQAHCPLTGVHVAGTQSPFIYLFFLHAVRLFSFVGLIQIPARDFQHLARVRGPSLFNVVNAVAMVLRSFCKEKN